MTANDSEIHSINLRGAWKSWVSVVDDSCPGNQPRKVNLPLSLSELSSAVDDSNLCIRLERRFSTPAGLSESQEVFLRVSSQCNHAELSLNGTVLANDCGNLEIPITHCLQRSFQKNVLEFSTTDCSYESRLNEVLLLIRSPQD